MFNIMKIPLKFKLFLIVLISALSLAIISYISFTNMGKITADKSGLYEASNLILNIDRDMYQSLSAAQHLMALDMSSKEYKEWTETYSENVTNVRERIAKTKEVTKNFTNKINQFKTGEKKFEENIDLFITNFNDWEKRVQYLVGLQYDHVSLITASEQEMAFKFELAREYLSSMEEMINGYTTERIAQDDKTQQSAKNSIIITIITVLVVLIAFSILFIRSLTKSIQSIVEKMSRLSKGDFTIEKVDVETKDEVGKLQNAINNMVDNMKVLIKETSEMAKEVESSSGKLTNSSNNMKNEIEQIAATTEELSIGANSQASQASNTLEMIKKIDIEIKEITGLASEMTEISKNGEGASQKGMTSVQESTEQMRMIENRVSQTVTVVKALSEKSKEVTQILNVIQDISQQTNLLALNAAIEAARAGEHGQGFAIVAEEVRRLAEQTSQSTERIADIIDSVQAEAEEAGQAMAEVTQEVNIGTDVIDKNGKSFSAITEVMNDIIQKIEKIAVATRQINDRIDEEVLSVENIASVSEESTAGTEELSSWMEQQNVSMQDVALMAQSLAQVAVQLNQSISRFKYE